MSQRLAREAVGFRFPIVYDILPRLDKVNLRRGRVAEMAHSDMGIGRIQGQGTPDMKPIMHDGISWQSQIGRRHIDLQLFIRRHIPGKF